MGDWDPQQYLRFKAERTQPSIDLASKIKIDGPADIIDIGCGPGNSTRILHLKWPDARITGLDNSFEMIEQARKDYPNQTWVLADISMAEPSGEYDIVFSNAVLQWIQNHEILIPRLFKIVRPGGAMAIQVPANNGSPIHKALVSISSDKKWAQFTSGTEKLLNYQTAEYYYSILCPLAAGLDIWETTYYHVMPSHEALVEWYKGTGMRPFLQKLPDEQARKDFAKEVLSECKLSYKTQEDGKILFPFKRIFFIAYKKQNA